MNPDLIRKLYQGGGPVQVHIIQINETQEYTPNGLVYRLILNLFKEDDQSRNDSNKHSTEPSFDAR